MENSVYDALLHSIQAYCDLHDWFSPAFHMIGAKFGATRLLRVSKLILIFGRTIALINEKTAFYVDLRH